MLGEMRGERNWVVVRFKDGRLLKGHTFDFTPARETFHLASEQEEDKGNIYEVNTNDVKAVFFVKTLEGDKGYREKKSFGEVDTSDFRGLKIRVEFSDGEVLSGISLGYSKNREGFFIIPVDPESNNERIYVLAHAVVDVKVGSNAEK